MTIDLTSHNFRLIIYTAMKKNMQTGVMVLENKTIGRVKIVKQLSDILDAIICKYENSREINADDRKELSEIRKFLLDFSLPEG